MLRMDSVKENKNELNKNGAQGEFPFIQHLFWTVKLFIKKHLKCEGNKYEMNCLTIQEIFHAAVNATIQ